MGIDKFRFVIKVIKSGLYRLIETRQAIKILYLDDVPYVWLYISGIGYVLEVTHKDHKSDHLLAKGNFRLYDVKDDEKYSTHQHLELCAGGGQWQGYFLLTGLPTGKKNKTRIIATGEVISTPSV